MKHLHSSPASPRCEPCTDPSPSFSCFPSFAHLPPPLRPRGLQCPYQTVSLYSVAHDSRVLWGSTWRQRQFGGPTCTEAGMQGRWSSTRGWEAGKQSASGEFPSVQLSACCAFPSSNRILRPMDFLTFIGIPFPC